MMNTEMDVEWFLRRMPWRLHCPQCHFSPHTRWSFKACGHSLPPCSYCGHLAKELNVDGDIRIIEAFFRQQYRAQPTATV